jgi:hypothetical protein
VRVAPDGRRFGKGPDGRHHPWRKPIPIPIPQLAPVLSSEVSARCRPPSLALSL